MYKKSVLTMFVFTAALLSAAAFGFAADESAEVTDVIVDVPDPNQAPSAAAPGSDVDKQSYAVGVQIGNSLTKNDLNLNSDMVLTAVKDVLAGNKLAMTEEEIEGALMSLQQQMMAKQQEKMQADQQNNLKDANDFLAENAKKDGIVSLASGLQYRVVKAGDGAKPQAESKVRVHYKGTLLDGTEFDSSFKRGEPAEFTVNGVIQGWQEALQLMPVGSSWQLFIPPDLAYGDRGNQSIPANSLLIFDVELIEIVE